MYYIMNKECIIKEYDYVKNVRTAVFARITYTTKDVPFEHYF
ncbi:hypothetical protein [Ruminococcus sp.]|nr:hypothetical protein [Ruminococcus sp.]